jgi:hypothetical protein
LRGFSLAVILDPLLSEVYRLGGTKTFFHFPRRSLAACNPVWATWGEEASRKKMVARIPHAKRGRRYSRTVVAKGCWIAIEAGKLLLLLWLPEEPGGERELEEPDS